jgi:hypothetical protein
MHVVEEVNAWIIQGNVRPMLPWLEVGPAYARAAPVIIKGLGLFGALAYQLLLSVGRTSGLIRCSACGSEYDARAAGRKSTRRPQAGRRN